MGDQLAAVGVLLGVGGGTAVAILVVALAVRAAIAKAVTQAGDRELARLKSSLDAQLDEKRRAFQREIENEKAAAARELGALQASAARELETLRSGAASDLERMKSELTLGSEMRRQLAIKRIEVLASLRELSEPLVRKAWSPDTSLDDMIGAAGKLQSRLRDVAHLLDAAFEEELWNYVATMGKARQLVSENKVDEAIALSTPAYEALKESFRREYGVVARPARG